MKLFNRFKADTKALAVLTSWLGEGAKVVDKPTAEARSQVCLSCPMHTAAHALEESAANVVLGILRIKNQAELVLENEHRLAMCSVCGCVLRLKLWLPIDKIKLETSVEEFNRLWKNCWIKLETPQTP